MKSRILLVDDDRAVLLTLRAVLEINGFEVDTAESAAAAIASIEREQYAVVISDSHMEAEDSGFQVLQVARQQAYHPATVMLSAFPPEKAGAVSVEAGNAVLLKPIGAQDLLLQIEALLQPGQNSQPDTPEKRRPQADRAFLSAAKRENAGKMS